MQTMSNADFDELIRQRNAAIKPAPRAEDIPRAPKAETLPRAPRAEDLPRKPSMSATDSIAAKREQARKMGRTPL